MNFRYLHHGRIRALYLLELGLTGVDDSPIDSTGDFNGQQQAVLCAPPKNGRAGRGAEEDPFSELAGGMAMAPEAERRILDRSAHVADCHAGN